nr:hypothetical protein [Tanacetum cinerariifolium]
MTPFTIATITTSSEEPIPPPTIPSIILENLPTFNSAFSFEERLRSLETSFFEYRQTNPFVDAVSAIPVRESEGESEEEETRQEEEENFDPIPRTPEESEDESNDEEEQDLRLSEEARIQDEEDADELYRDVNINQGRGLQVTQNVEDTHV